jgi:hypothetical protein
MTPPCQDVDSVRDVLVLHRLGADDVRVRGHNHDLVGLPRSQSHTDAWIDVAPSKISLIILPWKIMYRA